MAVAGDGIDPGEILPREIALQAIARNQNRHAPAIDVIGKQNAAVCGDVVEKQASRLVAHDTLSAREADGVERVLSGRPPSRKPDLASVQLPCQAADEYPSLREHG